MKSLFNEKKMMSFVLVEFRRKIMLVAIKTLSLFDVDVLTWKLILCHDLVFLSANKRVSDSSKLASREKQIQGRKNIFIVLLLLRFDRERRKTSHACESFVVVFSHSLILVSEKVHRQLSFESMTTVKNIGTT